MPQIKPANISIVDTKLKVKELVKTFLVSNPKITKALIDREISTNLIIVSFAEELRNQLK